MKNHHHKPDENKFYIREYGTYISKVGEFYKAFRGDGTEITEAVIPINISLMSLKGMLPGAVKVYPTQEEIEIEPALIALLEK